VYNSGDKLDKQEYRFYFANDKCIKFLETIPVAATGRLYKKENWEDVLKEAQKYQQVFLSGFH